MDYKVLDFLNLKNGILSAVARQNKIYPPLIDELEEEIHLQLDIPAEDSLVSRSTELLPPELKEKMERLRNIALCLERHCTTPDISNAELLDPSPRCIQIIPF
jgi:hypothetical protein